MDISTNVIYLKDHRPRMTAERLIQEARAVRTGPLEDVLIDMPNFLAYFLGLILSEHDYCGSLSSDTSIACRGIAALASYLDEQLAGVDRV